MVKSNLKEEERLVEEIPKFSYLYDKSNKGYKEKDWEKNALHELEKFVG